MRPAAFFALTWLCGCGYVGDPKPPTLDMPMRVTDLRAAEYGSKILADFTIPPLTTEGLALEGVKAIELRVSAGTDTRVLSVPPHEPGAVQFDFSAEEWIGKTAAVSVRAVGPKNKAGDWSNVVTLPVVPPLPTPTGLMVEATSNGVDLNWQAPGQHFRVFRSLAEKPAEKLADVDKPEYTDATAEFGTAYRYFVQTIDGDLHQSVASEVATITPIDKFAPAIPAGVSALAGADSIELTWERNTESDFAGYNIYRSIDGGSAEKIADKITAPTYSDRMIMVGRRYSYEVSSVDQIGNESSRSMPVEVTAQ